MIKSVCISFMDRNFLVCCEMVSIVLIRSRKTSLVLEPFIPTDFQKANGIFTFYLILFITDAKMKQKNKAADMRLWHTT